MISLNKNNNQKVIINCEQIETIESIPETKITTWNSHSFIVKDSVDEVIEKIIEYKRQCYKNGTN